MAVVILEKRVTVPDLISRKNSNRKIVALTAYDYSFARLIDLAGVDLILVGDSLASVVQGLSTTLPVTLEEMVYHCRCVASAVGRAVVVGDLPFMSYQLSSEQACQSAGVLVKEGGIAAVKLEGGVKMFDAIEKIVSIDIPVMGHVGLTPQSYHRMGGYRVQGRESSSARSNSSRARIIEDALAVQEAGAFSIVLEGIPVDLASEITERLEIPTIGIGAGDACDGQILVTHDLLGISEHTPKFVKRYSELAKVIHDVVQDYIAEVQAGKFPAMHHSYSKGPLIVKKEVYGRA
jgi:3-methyl-2-oxobutanoate hydroxymethyltransferase